MIKFEKYIGDLKGKKVLYSTINWLEIEDSLSLLNEDKESIEIFKEEKLNDTSIKISVDDNQYIKIANFNEARKGESPFYTGFSDSNYSNKDGELSLNTDRPKELWIELDVQNISFEHSSNQYKAYYIDVINENDKNLERYYILVEVCHKNEGKIGNTNFNFDVKVLYYKVKMISITYDTIDCTFCGYFIWFIINLAFFNKNGVFSMRIIQEYYTYAIFASYISYLYFRTKYIENSWLNNLECLLDKKKRKQFITNKDVKKYLKEQYKQSENNKIKKENK